MDKIYGIGCPWDIRQLEHLSEHAGDTYEKAAASMDSLLGKCL